MGGEHLDLPWLCASPYPLELRREAVESYRRTRRPLGELARELGVPVAALARWVETSEERDELDRLRRENRGLREELERARGRTRRLSSKP